MNFKKYSRIIVFILSIITYHNAFSQNKYQVAFSGHYVSFGTWDILGYGLSSSFQKDIVKKPKFGFAGFKIGGEILVDLGSNGTQSYYQSPTFSDAKFAVVSMSNIWIKASYYPFNKYISGFNISLGPTFGYKSEVYGKNFIFTPVAGTELYKKEITEFAHEKSFNYGYRISLGYDFEFFNKKYVIGMRTDFYNNNLGDVNSLLGIKLGYNFSK